MTLEEAIAKRIMDLCDERNITINRLSMLAGLSRSTLDNIVSGNSKNPNIRTIYRIAKGFGMTVSQFLDTCGLNDMIAKDNAMP